MMCVCVCLSCRLAVLTDNAPWQATAVHTARDAVSRLIGRGVNSTGATITVVSASSAVMATCNTDHCWWMVHEGRGDSRHRRLWQPSRGPQQPQNAHHLHSVTASTTPYISLLVTSAWNNDCYLCGNYGHKYWKKPMPHPHFAEYCRLSCDEIFCCNISWHLKWWQLRLCRNISKTLLFIILQKNGVFLTSVIGTSARGKSQMWQSQCCNVWLL